MKDWFICKLNLLFLLIDEWLHQQRFRLFVSRCFEFVRVLIQWRLRNYEEFACYFRLLSIDKEEVESMILFEFLSWQWGVCETSVIFGNSSLVQSDKVDRLSDVVLTAEVKWGCVQY